MQVLGVYSKGMSGNCLGLVNEAGFKVKILQGLSLG